MRVGGWEKSQRYPTNAQFDFSEGTRIIISRDGYLEQADYRVSYNGPLPSAQDLASLQQNSQGMTTEQLIRQNATIAAMTPPPPDLSTSEALQPNPLVVQLSEGKPVLTTASLRIEHIPTNQVRFLFIVFLENGDIKTTWLQ